jgi:toxin-antitoxin system PIN domain toxin
MKLPDVNLLVYAFRHDAAFHAVARSWLNDTIAGDARFAVSRLALAAFVRIVTNRRIHPNATPMADAFGLCDDLLSQPHCEIIEPGERHWDIFRRLCLETGTRGPDTTDAWYAALAIEWGCEWVTFDRDFLKFPGLNCTLLKPPPV